MATENLIGNWGFAENEEGLIFNIAKDANKYKVSVFFAGKTSEVWAATLSKGKLIGSNKSSIKLLSKDRILLKNFYMEGSDDTELVRMKAFSNFYGIWKPSPTDKEFITISRTKCPDGPGSPKPGVPPPGSLDNCYNVILDRNIPPWEFELLKGKAPLNSQDAFEKDNVLTTKLTTSPTAAVSDAVSIKFLSDGKILVNWKEEKIFDKIYIRVAPLILFNSKSSP